MKKKGKASSTGMKSPILLVITENC